MLETGRLRTGLAAAALTALLALPTPLRATGPPQVHALTGVRIVVAPGQVIDTGTVVLRDGVIEAAGTGVQVPADAREWDRAGLTVYAGLIEPYLPRPWPEAAPTRGERDTGNPPQGGDENPQVHPEREMAWYAFDAEGAARLRRAGFTTALVAPEPGILRGSSALLNLGDGDLSSNLLRPVVAQHASLRPGGRSGYPDSIMGAVALFRQTILDARWYAAASRAYQRNPAQERPAFNRSLEVLQPAIQGEQLVIFESRDLLDTLRDATVAAELGLKAAIVGSGQEYQRLELVRQAGVPLLLPVNFPEAPQVGKEGEDDLTVSLAALRHWNAAPDNPSQLLNAGVTVAFTSFRLSTPQDLFPRLATAEERGLTQDQALAALTTTPAALLGMSERLGTVEKGKIANLVVVEGDLFVSAPKIREVWIDGRRYEVKESKPPSVDPAGDWQLTIHAAGREFPLGLHIEGKVGAQTGTVTGRGDRVMPLISVEVSGSSVEVSYDGSPSGLPGIIQLRFKIEGDQASGTGESPRGSFTLDGRRTGTAPAPGPTPQGGR